ncbi:hypothetical protein KGO95_00770 [Patescibacteria group bacterium]|nr:hypothetical protein [Patescibacteria group bacterium]
MGGKEEEYKPAERTIHLTCQLQLIQDVTLVLIARYGDDPERVELKAGLGLTLVDDRQMFCAVEDKCSSSGCRCDSGPLVRIDESKGVEIDRRYIGRAVVIPARLLTLHPNVL